MNIRDPYIITCPACHLQMERIETFREDRIAFDAYKCPEPTCAKNVGVIFEPDGGFNEEERSFIEREIARRGAFFPSDYRSMGSRWKSG